MTLDSAQRETLNTLLFALRDDQLTQRQATELEQLVLGDVEAMQHYLRVANLSVGLHWMATNGDEGGMIQRDELGTRTDELAKIPSESPFAEHSAPVLQHSPPPSPFFIDTSLPSSIPPRPYSFIDNPLFSYLVAAVLMSVGLSIASLWKMPDRSPIASTSVTNSSSVASTALSPSTISASKAPFVGQITGMVDCQWADRRTATLDRASVPVGRKYALASGIMQITYDTGTKVVLQGPCTYEVKSATGGYLSLGKLTARVEKRSEVRGQRSVASNEKSEIRNPKSEISTLPSPLFTIKTPTATVTDLGTEFGVEVAESGNTSACVFHGVIEMQPIAKNLPAVRLIENESAQVAIGDNGEGPILRRIAANPASFVRPEKLGQVAREAREKQRLAAFHRWQSHSLELRRDPTLLAYYDCQLEDGKPSVLHNLAADGDRSLDGLVETVTWSDGRMAGKHSLQFNSLSDYVEVNLPRQVDDLTLTAWMQVQSLDGGLIGLLMSTGWGQLGQIHWQLTDDGRVALDAYETSGRNWIYKSEPVFSHQRFYRWTHLAVVYDHTAGLVRFYADAQPVGEMQIVMVTPLCIGEARLGQWNTNGFHETAGVTRGFRGAIDEMAIFGRALSAEDIQSLFVAGTAKAAQQKMTSEPAAAQPAAIDSQPENSSLHQTCDSSTTNESGRGRYPTKQP